MDIQDNLFGETPEMITSWSYLVEEELRGIKHEDVTKVTGKKIVAFRVLLKVPAMLEILREIHAAGRRNLDFKIAMLIVTSMVDNAVKEKQMANPETIVRSMRNLASVNKIPWGDVDVIRKPDIGRTI